MPWILNYKHLGKQLKMKNAYDTNDPQKLLELKRLEADALLDVLRTINHDELKVKQLCMVSRNILRAQLGVRKMTFYYESPDGWIEGIRLGFREFSDTVFSEILSMNVITPVSREEHPQLAKQKAEYVVPITNRGEAKAFFIIAEFADSEVEAQGDLIFIETLGNILLVAIHNKQLFKEKMEQEFLRKELEVAETIQKQLLISDFSRFREMDIFGLNIPHHGVGGDFYDVIKKEKGTTFLCIADVSGKGIAAALLMSNLQANLRALCAQYNDLTDIIQELNKILFNITTGEKFVTLFLIKVDSINKTLTYVNAGHNYPIFMQQSESQRLQKGCMLLGIIPDISIEETILPFEKGDSLFMFTDGVVEQYDPEEEMFGSDKLAEILEEVNEKDSKSLIEHIQTELNSFAKGIPPTDDITMLSVKFL